MLTPAIPAVEALSIRQHAYEALAILTGEVMDGQWVGKACGVTYTLVRSSDLENARVRLHQIAALAHE